MRRLRGEWWAVLAAVGFIGLELSIRAASAGVAANLGSFLRILPILVVSWIVTLLRRTDRAALATVFRRRGALVLAALMLDGVFNLYVGTALKLYALQQGGIVLTLTAVEVGNLVGAALLVRWLLGQVIPVRVQTGILAIIAGTWLASWSRIFVGHWALALVMALLAGLAYALAITAVGYALRQGMTLWSALAVSSTVGFVTAGIAAFASGEAPTPAHVMAGGGTVLGFLCLSGVAYAAALYFLTGALKRAPIVSVNAIAGANGPVAALVGAAIFGPAVTLLLVVGVILVGFGAVMARSHPDMEAERPGSIAHESAG